MSDSERSPGRVTLDTVVAEAKEHLDVAPKVVDWSRLEDKLMAAVRAEQEEQERSSPESLPVGKITRVMRAGRRREVLLRAGAIVLASAAAIALFVHKQSSTEADAARSNQAAASRPEHAEQAREPARGQALEQNSANSAREAIAASSLRATEGAGVVRVNRRDVVTGHVVHVGDGIEVVGARGVFERGTKVTWLIEGPNARASVKLAGESLVLGLDDGAIEAQVTPVPQGEAFAVDIATEHNIVRVAVHGTHLRVTRAGDRVAVDLTEGVISIGVPPRVGVTLGTLVTAPAHVELDATDLRTLRVDHGVGAVRAPIPLGPQAVSSRVARDEREESRGPAPAAPPAPPATANRGAVARPTGAVSTKSEPPKAKLPPRDVIAAAVRDCAAARSRSGDVAVTVTSNLQLRVSSTGEVEAAQFSPPLLPEIQTCAAQVIYRTKLDETGAVIVPIEFSF